MAELIAEVQRGGIVGWRKVGALFQDVGADGEVAPPDTRMTGAIMGALMADGTASVNGAVGINSRIVERQRAREERRLPAHLHSSAVVRAETQILDRLAGFNAVGVRLILAPTNETGDTRKA